MPKKYAVAVGCVVAILGALGQQGVMDPGLATALASLVGLVVTQFAHNAAPPAPPAPKA